jgi:cellulose synthase/poly-beta-1,6-N-acetylglucosamine synthase-like glycosyltransferase
MSVVLTILIVVLVVLVAVPMCTFIVECLAALLPPRKNPVASMPDARPRLAVLVPAHNEEVGLGETLDSIAAQLVDGDRLVVIADNCDDGTADLARTYDGVEVVERHDLRRRGKGYALAAGMDALRDDPPSIVVIIDADCHLQPHALQTLAATAAAADAPTQCVYLLDSAPDAGVLDRLSAFAFLVKNLVRQRGLMNLGQPALLQGTGMAFPWMVIDATPLSTGHIVEDLVIGLDLVEAGHAPRFCVEARVTSPQAGQKAAVSQRTRWEHGYLRTMLRRSPRLLGKGLLGRPHLLTVGLDLAVPPLSLLVLLYAAATVAVAVKSYLIGSYGFLIGLLLLGVMFAAVTLIVCLRFARDVIGVRTLLLAPFYAAWKLPIYLRFFTEPQTDWVRTDRDDDADPPDDPNDAAHDQTDDAHDGPADHPAAHRALTGTPS